MHKTRLRVRAALYRMRWMLGFVAFWFAAATLAFRWGGGLHWHDAVMSSLYFEVQPGVFSQGYSFWGQSMIFGVVVALLLREALENYKERCRLMAKMLKGHTIIVGYTHLGKRLVEHCLHNGIPYALIERDSALVDDLLRKGEPVVVDDACSADALPAVNVKEAKQLIIASNNLETAIILTKAARDANAHLRIAVRCHLDQIVSVLEKLGADQVYSTSLSAFNEIAKTLSA